eukprot:77816_1
MGFLDWFLFATCQLFLVALCFCFGCYSYKRCIGYEIPDSDVQEFSTPISPSRGTKKYTFAGFNIFGEKLTEIRTAHAHQMAPSRTGTSVTSHTPYSISTSAVPVTPKSVPSSIASDNEYTPRIDRSPSTKTVVVQMTPTQQSTSLNPPMMANIDAQQRTSLPRIQIPNGRNKIVPTYNVDGVITTPQTVQSPDSAEPSQSHLSIEINEVGGKVLMVETESK